MYGSREYVIMRLRQALFHLDNAINLLKKAENFSILDIILPFGLSMIPDFFEYDAYGRAMAEAHMALMILSELRYYAGFVNLDIPYIDGSTPLWMLLDVGFDNIIFDLLRHMKISEARKKLEDIRRSIIQALNSLSRARLTP